MLMASAAVIFAAAAPSGASASPGAGGLAEGPIEYVKTVPLDAGAAQVAKRVGDYLYLTSWKALSIYDVRDLLNPVHITTIPTGFQFPAERMDTNGKILIIAEQTPLVTIDSPLNRMHVFDVSDPAAPSEIAILEGTNDHTFTCVLDCRWAYGSHGTIVDLHDPESPSIVGNWNDGTLTYWHDVTEVSPGKVLTASMPLMKLLDGRKAITTPKHVAVGDATSTSTAGYLGTVLWPREGEDRYILGSEESGFSGRCDEQTSAFITWDTSGWKKTRTFEVADTFRLTNGTFADGSPPASVIGCSTHVFDAHPTFDNGGLVSLAHYEHGTRLLRVSSRGAIEEIGWFLPAGGSTSASYWMDDEIIYSIDFHRGLDILRYTGRS
jgi:hypothetical protein